MSYMKRLKEVKSIDLDKISNKALRSCLEQTSKDEFIYKSRRNYSELRDDSYLGSHCLQAYSEAYKESFLKRLFTINPAPPSYSEKKHTEHIEHNEMVHTETKSRYPRHHTESNAKDYREMKHTEQGSK